MLTDGSSLSRLHTCTHHWVQFRKISIWNPTHPHGYVELHATPRPKGPPRFVPQAHLLCWIFTDTYLNDQMSSEVKQEPCPYRGFWCGEERDRVKYICMKYKWNIMSLGYQNRFAKLWPKHDRPYSSSWMLSSLCGCDGQWTFNFFIQNQNQNQISKIFIHPRCRRLGKYIWINVKRTLHPNKHSCILWTRISQINNYGSTIGTCLNCKIIGTYIPIAELK